MRKIAFPLVLSTFFLFYIYLNQRTKILVENVALPSSPPPPLSSSSSSIASNITAFDVFIRSAYYYPQSESLGPNALAFIVFADSKWYKLNPNFTVRSTNSEGTSTTSVCSTTVLTPSYTKCHMFGGFATCSGVPNLNQIEIDVGESNFQPIQYQAVSYEKKDVVTCIAPLFAAEQWQIFLLAVHIRKRFGSFLHIYVRSAIQPVMDLMKAYEEEGYLKVQPWTRVKYASIGENIHNPNQYILFRGQDAAQTDCILQYKESAEFITLMDLDDILVPRLATTYLEEFELLLGSYHYIHYSKQNVFAYADPSFNSLSLSNLMETIRFTGRQETGKFATRPGLVNNTRIHYPNLQANAEGILVKKEQNVIVHLRNYSTIEAPYSGRLWPYTFNNEESTIFKQKDVDSIEEDFIRMKTKHTKVFASLPAETHYIQAINSCFEKEYYSYALYNREDELKGCMSPDICPLPQKVPTRCYNADGVFQSAKGGSRIRLHFVENADFSIDSRCIP